MRGILIWFLLIGFHFSAAASNECFPPKNENRLVYDLAGILNAEQIQRLEINLDTFAQRTSNQIVILITPDLCGWEPADYAFHLMDEWGIGQADLDNGIVILIKPKTTDSKGQAFIATGRGLEGALPDGKVHFIWENEMIPAFKQNDYFTGISNAVAVIESIAQKEYSIDTYAKKKKKGSDKGTWMALLIFGGILAFYIFGRSRQTARANHLPFWTAFWLMNSGPRRGYWNDFNGGSHWGGGGGGFGGFGGGSSGGGGAGGSW